MFQHALLKALFHNMAIALLIERVRTFLYMQELLHHSNTLDHAHQLHTFSVSLVFLELKQTPQKKGRSQRPYMYIFNGLLTICYKTIGKH